MGRAHTSTHTPQQTSQEWRGAAETRTQAHTPMPHTPARSGGVQAKQAHKNTQSPTPEPGVAGRSQNPNPTPTQTQTQAPRNSRKPSVHSPGTEAAHAMQVTRPNEIRSPGVRLHPRACPALGLEAERATPKHLETLVPRTCMDALGTGYARKSGEPLGFRPKEGTSASTAGHPPGMTTETQAQAHTPTPHTPARTGGEQGEPAHKHEHPNTPARSGGAQPKPEPRHTSPNCTPQPGLAGYKRSAHTNTHRQTAHPSQERRGTEERAHEHTHTQTPKPGVAGCSRNSNPSTHSHAAHPSQEWRGTRGAGTKTRTTQHPSHVWRGATKTQAHTPTPTPHNPARSGGVQTEHTNSHTHTPTTQPGVAERSPNPNPSTHTHAAHRSQEWRGTRGARTQTRTPQHPSQEWRDAAETPAQTHTATPYTAHLSQEWRGTRGARTPVHTQPTTPARSGGAQPKLEPKHTHPRRTPQPRVAGCKWSAHTSRHKLQHPSLEWRGAAETRAHTHTPTPYTPARSGGVQGEQAHKHTHTPKPQPGVAGRSGNPNPTTTQTQTQAPRNSRKPSVHTPGTEAARAMQVTRPNVIRSPGVRLHPKACAALRLEAERTTPKHLRTLVPRTCMHAFGTGYARKSGECLGFRLNEGSCASTTAHPPGMTTET